jgi:RNA polymerase sigma factor for flagellar operon FliA
MVNDDLLKMYNEVGALSLMSIDEEMEPGSGHSFLEILADDAADNPITDAEKKELQFVLEQEISILQERERLVIALYYYEELTFKEIGSILELTESRISQIHAKTLLKLRTKLEAHTINRFGN